MPKQETYFERQERQRLGNLFSFEENNLDRWIVAVCRASEGALQPDALLSSLMISMFEGLVIRYHGTSAEGEAISDPISIADVRRIDQRRGFGYSVLKATKAQTPIEQAFRMWSLDFFTHRSAPDKLKDRAFYFVWALEVFG